MPRYNALHFDPPAPLAQVTLRDVPTGATVTDVLLLIDTGADITLLPRRAIERLGVVPLADQQYALRGFDGRTSMAPVVVVDMVFLRRAFRGRYLVIEAERGILGRDILNHVIVLLDGPQQHWSEHVP
jgi:predicted aspartyl protease